MFKNSRKNLRLAAMAVSLINGYWASLTQTSPGHGSSWSPVLMAMVSVWAVYFSLAWLLQGMRSK